MTTKSMIFHKIFMSFSIFLCQIHDSSNTIYPAYNTIKIQINIFYITYHKFFNKILTYLSILKKCQHHKQNLKSKPPTWTSKTSTESYSSWTKASKHLSRKINNKKYSQDTWKTKWTRAVGQGGTVSSEKTSEPTSFTRPKSTFSSKWGNSQSCYGKHDW
mgnify:CR=1 FL=1